MRNWLITCSFLLLIGCSKKSPSLFREIDPAASGLHFNNEIKEDDILNVVNYEYLYNGGGVGIGDFNNDSLPDVFFTGSLVPCRLFLNKGQMKFEDITEKAGISTKGKWCKGVSVIDINNDGLMDVYVSAAVIQPASFRENLLYINQGIDKNSGIPSFKEEAKEYGLADTSNTHMAAFFDYDNDGDLDVYLLVNDLNKEFTGEFRPVIKDGSFHNTDRLLRNDWNEQLHHPVFTNVSKESGISWEGYGLGVNIVDINNDGWKDIYVSDDYASDNLLYINNKNGTFTNKCSSYFKKTSRNAMGNDIADINNDGLPDVIELDMMAEDNYRQKIMMSPINYRYYQNSAQYGYMYQAVRNTLQLNQGRRLLGNDSIGDPIFSEVAYAAGIPQTDWSWAPLAVDVDNDGWRDIMITNGLPKDMSDLDFVAYRNEAMAKTSLGEVLKQLPSIKLSNYIYRNNHDISFTDKTQDWGWSTPTFSAGMAYADLDRDGDVDVIINNTNMEASLLENTLNESKGDSSHYLRVQLQGDEKNRNGIGSVIRVFSKGQQQFYECTPYRGYMSTVENVAHFGVGATTKIDSLIVEWPNGKRAKLQDIMSNQVITLKISDAHENTSYSTPVLATSNLLTDITGSAGITYNASEFDFIDFTIQRLLPHKLSQYGPSMAAGDMNGDGLDDFIAGGDAPLGARVFFQQADGKFIEKNFANNYRNKPSDDAGICLFDADNDNDPDVFIGGGGYENAPLSPPYVDHLFINDGKGNYKEDTMALPRKFTSKSCVKACDIDHDGDLDLFVGGRVTPGSYPYPVSSFIYRNDSKNEKATFTDVTNELAPDLQSIGMICDATWSDADNDGDMDLILAGEWMPLTILINNNGSFSKTKTNLQDERGWWNSITAADIDNDGDMDYILGNTGTNGYIRPSKNYPARIYAKDFDNNQSMDAILSSYQPAHMHGDSMKEYPLARRDELIVEITPMKNKFPNYSSYARADMSLVLSDQERSGALKLVATTFNTYWIENKGNLQFELHALPAEAQRSVVYGIVAADINSDGNIDIILNGNEFGMAPHLGRYDAMNGLVLTGDGKGKFDPLSIMQSGLFIPGNGKALVQLASGDHILLAASQNQGDVRLFKQKTSTGKMTKINPDDISAIITLKDGRRRKEEFSYGSSFYSQSARFIQWNANIRQVEITNSRNQKRLLTP